MRMLPYEGCEDVRDAASGGSLALPTEEVDVEMGNMEASAAHGTGGDEASWLPHATVASPLVAHMELEDEKAEQAELSPKGHGDNETKAAS